MYSEKISVLKFNKVLMYRFFLIIWKENDVFSIFYFFMFGFLNREFGFTDCS